MNLKEFSVKIFNKTLTVVATDINAVGKCYPGADIAQLQGTHFFIGDGSSSAQSLTKATPILSHFTAVYSTTTIESSTSVPSSSQMTLAAPNSVAFSGPSGCSAYIWTYDDITFQYDQNVTIKFEKAGTYVVKLITASDGGQSSVEYVKITVT